MKIALFRKKTLIICKPNLSNRNKDSSVHFSWSDRAWNLDLRKSDNLKILLDWNRDGSKNHFYYQNQATPHLRTNQQMLHKLHLVYRLKE